MFIHKMLNGKITLKLSGRYINAEHDSTNNLCSLHSPCDIIEGTVVHGHHLFGATIRRSIAISRQKYEFYKSTGRSSLKKMYSDISYVSL